MLSRDKESINSQIRQNIENKGRTVKHGQVVKSAILVTRLVSSMCEPNSPSSRGDLLNLCQIQFCRNVGMLGINIHNLV